MPSFDVAHLNKSGQDMIIIPLGDNFRNKSQSEQHAIVEELQERADAAGLAGTVVAVWDGGGGRMSFIAPRPWHPFFKSINLRYVAMNINRKLYW